MIDDAVVSKKKNSVDIFLLPADLATDLFLTQSTQINPPNY